MLRDSLHAKLAPSAANFWANCPGWVEACEGIPNDTNRYAAEGTVAHKYRDFCLKTGTFAEQFIGQTEIYQGTESRWNGESFDVAPVTYEFTWTEDDARLLQFGIDEVRIFEGEFFGEYRVDISKWLGPDQFGTLDAAIVSDDLIVINDHKWGRYIPVSAVQNKQMMLYALGFWWNVARNVSSAKDFLIIIDQPRCYGGGGRWHVTLDELLAFGETIGALAEAALTPGAPRRAGTQCGYCLRLQHFGCDAHDNLMKDLTMEAEQVREIGRAVTPEQRSRLILHKGMIEKWLDELAKNALVDYLDGKQVPLLKAIEGRANPRKYVDDEAATVRLTETLGDRAMAPPKVLSPTQLEKLIGPTLTDAAFGDLITRKPSTPVLVPVEDSRPAIPVVTAMFDDIE
ncbi:DUF2800 domain-containing protein [Sphingopyxis sp. GW247-27LB]|uniref:DUF2800 domain-containing protein n=1 Tax=Sphingopyxis sp. GW247-27LB TaxID=2012632 RepID=UPI000BA62649|nr:DUF2800 domain-containing protein [Sphingopyxis sp. GW247-27LB]PAL23595.1 hypothetical protein CD928_05875 [Sphingopyxis sp. GW247-27LB]